ncbi:MAG TPA: hypothetical protein VMI06_08970 [Terriglobia bacterium]|nr:hypothetical protein [Terriglobia bacterium]
MRPYAAHHGPRYESELFLLHLKAHPHEEAAAIVLRSDEDILRLVLGLDLPLARYSENASAAGAMSIG